VIPERLSGAVVLPAPADTDELLATANREYEAGRAAAEASLSHAIACGEALLELRTRLKAAGDNWQAWCERHFAGSYCTANRLIRIAVYKERLPHTAMYPHEALAALSDLPVTRGYSALRVEAERLAASTDMTPRQIAMSLGVAHSTVGTWLDPRRRQKQREAEAASRRRRKAAQRALRQQDRDDAMRRHGGGVAECYSLVRKTAQQLDRTADRHEDPEVRHALREALSAIARAEDLIVRAVGVA
jgi:hypothetical protein